MNINIRCIALSIVLLWTWSVISAQPPHASKRTHVHDDTATNAKSLRDLSASMELLSARVGPSVVQVFSTGYALEAEDADANAGLFSRQRSVGSGIVISADGFIMTNAHVVQGARHVRVRLTHQPGSPQLSARIVEAKVMALDRESDLALIKIEAVGLPFLTLADSNGLKQGQLVLAFGQHIGA
jgi:S1-C subfamily serine protease